MRDILVHSPRAGQGEHHNLISALSRFLEEDVEAWLEALGVKNPRRCYVRP